MISTLIGIVWTLGYSVAALCAGAMLLRLIAWRAFGELSTSPLAKLAMAFLLGQGVLAGVWVVAAVFGAMTKMFILISLGAVAACGVLPAMRLGSGVVGQVRDIFASLRSLSAAWKIIFVLVIVQVLALGLLSFLPPRGDAATHYMVWPAVIADTASLHPLPRFELLMQMGHQGDMHYAAIMALGVTVGQKFILWPTCIAAAIELCSIGTICGLNFRGRLMAMAMLFTSTAYIYVCEDGKLDIFAIGLALASIFWTMQCGGGRYKYSAAVLAGVFAGLAIVARVSYVVWLAPCVAMILIFRIAADGQLSGLAIRAKRFFLSASVLVACLLAAMSIHFFKNAIMYDQPMAPFKSRYVGWQGKANAASPGLEVSPKLIATYPLLPFLGRYEYQHGNISILAIMALPLVLLLWPGRRWWLSSMFTLAVAALLGLAAYVVVLPLSFQTRNFLPPLLIFVLLAAKASARVWDLAAPARVVKFLIVTVAIVLLAMIIQSEVRPARQAAAFCAGSLSESAIVGTDYEIASAVNSHVAPPDRLATEHSWIFWYSPTITKGLCTYDEIVRLKSLPNDAARWHGLYDMGFKYVLFDHRHETGREEMLRLFVVNSVETTFDKKSLPGDLLLTPAEQGKDFVLYRFDKKDDRRLR